ncbi:MAG: RIP metalloprotease RseP [Lysobacterales bacterium]
MGDFIGSVWWLIVALGVLVTFHEYGHYWVARRCGVRVLRFSVGFGSPVFKRVGNDGTEYVLAALPLGGYVKMLDERETPVANEERHESFNAKSLSQRSAIIAAGPIFNLAFALLAFALMFMVGVSEPRLLLDETNGLAAEAGLRQGEQVVAVDGVDTQTLTHASIELLGFALDRQDVEITVEDSRGRQRTADLRLSGLPEDFDEENLLSATGLNLHKPRGRPYIDRVIDGDAADLAGIRSGDLVLSIAGDPIETSRDLSTVIQKHVRPEKALEVVVRRGDAQLRMDVVPQLVGRGDDAYYALGVYPYDPEDKRLWTIFQYGPLDSVKAAFSECYRITTATVGLIGRMLTGSASLKNLSGPISIAQYARDSARLGLSRFLFFLGVLSLSLAILNFLPIPMLDGGQLLYNLIEWATGKPVSERIQIAGQYVGLTLLVGLMTLTFYNDILRLMS